ncbi:MDR family MFS transporter [uncultured Megasphaera sp.]|uniref:MDR family MFS transporter n=1 Tax=uncultured Megasphaera sp. TaxID=165188 RepID=UPI00265B15A1|nr:MDR family MFS transporter [uncultured Megasphaera sp.]
MDRRKKTIAFAFFVAIFLAAFEGVVVSAAAPVIVKSFQQFDMISWIFSMYLLTTAVSTPLYGKLADMYGRKKMLMIGISIFLTGSTLCGLSRGMEELIVLRCIQGLGAGSILTICFTLIGDIFSLKERAVIQGGISTVWGIAGLVGPLLGGFLIDYVSWHWIFFINIPFGILCLVILSTYVQEAERTGSHHIDYGGAVLLSVCISSLLYAIMTTPEATVYTYLCWLCAAVTAVLFYYQETRAAEPIVPVFILSGKKLSITGITFIASFILISNTVYIPLHMQTLMGYSATVAGLSMVTISVSWFGSSFFLSRYMQKFEARKIVMAASGVLFFSSASLQLLPDQAPVWLVPVLMFPFGIGFSFTLNTLIFIVQDSVPYEQRGAAVGLNMLTRTIAQAVGVTLLGAVINSSSAAWLSVHAAVPMTMQDMYMPGISPDMLSVLREALLFALHRVYAVSALAAVIAVVVSYFVPPYSKAE